MNRAAVAPPPPQERGPGGEVGPERDPATGLLLPGATRSPRHQYNLAQLGLAWHPNVEAEPEFAQFVAELKEEIKGELRCYFVTTKQKNCVRTWSS